MNQKLAEVRILAARKMPYMTHQVMTLIPVERPGLGTMAVDEYCRMYFDPAFLEARHSRQWAVGSRQWRGKRRWWRGERGEWRGRVVSAFRPPPSAFLQSRIPLL